MLMSDFGYEKSTKLIVLLASSPMLRSYGLLHSSVASFSIGEVPGVLWLDSRVDIMVLSSSTGIIGSDVVPFFGKFYYLLII